MNTQIALMFDSWHLYLINICRYYTYFTIPLFFHLPLCTYVNFNNLCRKINIFLLFVKLLKILCTLLSIKLCSVFFYFLF